MKRFIIPLLLPAAAMANTTTAYDVIHSGDSTRATLFLICFIAITIYFVRQAANGYDEKSRRRLKMYAFAAWLSLPVSLFAALGNFASGKNFHGVIFLFYLLITARFLFNRHMENKRLIKKTEEREREVKDEVNQIYDGQLPIVRARKAIIRDGEIAHFSESAKLVENITTGYTSGGASVRVRVVKGVSIGTGRGRSRAIKENAIVARGELVITDMRVIFAGDKKSFEAPLTKLTSFESFADGVIFHISSKSYTLTLDEYDARVADAILTALLH
ncbi:hypothetical protein [Serratia microhaemolytica]|uniref:hypothetical protein n=1 Tax=Serratia microhaemolytica TaxID=2675110 RepID=UPI000FDD1E91|nr:hypothetical protein [Serratia microhaemolytica]